MAGQTGQATCEPKRSQVGEAVARLANALDRSASVQGMVYDRLNNVLAPEDIAKADPDSAPQAPVAHLAYELNDLIDRLEAQTDAYLALQQRLQN